MLHFLNQEHILIIPKSTNLQHIKNNFDVFDFELSDEDMKKMSSLDLNESQFFSHRDPAAIESIFGSSLKALRD